LILDCDLRTGSLTKRLLGNNNGAGLTNLIVSDTRRANHRPDTAAQLAETVVPLEKGLAILPAGPLPPNPTGLLSSKTLGELIARFRDQYELIVIDSPPVAHLADASLLASLSDAVVLVARVGTTKRKDLAMAAASLRHTPTPIVGAVVFERKTSASVYYPAPSRERAKTPRAASAS
jgi:tyrosine-protein kinase Etk/Wzc